MGRLQVGAIILAAMAMTGCPSGFGREGRIDKAVHQDVQDNLIITRCSEARKKEVCEGPTRNPVECEKCGGP
jgi:hypothetical protein